MNQLFNVGLPDLYKPMDKDKMLRQTYYSESGVANKVVTNQKAEEIIPSITQKDVNDWFDKQTSQQLKRTGGFHSYVADRKLQQAHFDFADFKRGSENIGYKYACIAIVIFTKVVTGCPTKRRTAEDCKEALEFVIDKLGRFEELYTDFEEGFQSNQIARLLNQHKIKHITDEFGIGMNYVD
jgi:hypothetical protein